MSFHVCCRTRWHLIKEAAQSAFSRCGDRRISTLCLIDWVCAMAFVALASTASPLSTQNFRKNKQAPLHFSNKISSSQGAYKGNACSFTCRGPYSAPQFFSLDCFQSQHSGILEARGELEPAVRRRERDDACWGICASQRAHSRKTKKNTNLEEPGYFRRSGINCR